MGRRKPPEGDRPAGVAGLGARGSALWSALNVVESSAAGAVALEACRIADRLEELDRIIAGEGVLDMLRFRLHPAWWDDDGQHVTVSVSFADPMAEARQQAATMTALLSKLGLSTKAAPSGGEESPLARIFSLVQPASDSSGGAG